MKKNAEEIIIVPIGKEICAEKVLRKHGYKVFTCGYLICNWNCSKDNIKYECLGWAFDGGKTIGVKIKKIRDLNRINF